VRRSDGKVCYFKGHSGEINQAEFSSDGKYILTGSEDGTAKLWNIKGKLIKTFEDKFETQYTTATFSRDGQSAIVSSKDNNIDFGICPNNWRQQRFCVHITNNETQLNGTLR
jgi:WD40 repeat protein